MQVAINTIPIEPIPRLTIRGTVSRKVRLNNWPTIGTKRTKGKQFVIQYAIYLAQIIDSNELTDRIIISKLPSS